jgi:hypothetical protein
MRKGFPSNRCLASSSRATINFDVFTKCKCLEASNKYQCIPWLDTEECEIDLMTVVSIRSDLKQ